jgi:hypothetical protein
MLFSTFLHSDDSAVAVALKGAAAMAGNRKGKKRK